MARSQPIVPSNLYLGALIGYQSAVTLALAHQGDFWTIGMFINADGLLAHFGTFTALRRSHAAIVLARLFCLDHCVLVHSIDRFLIGR